MSPAGYIARSVVHHRFAYAGVLAGAVLSATVLLGALFAGDSVRASLKRIANLRIGRATHALTGGERFFRQGLAADLATRTNAAVAPVLYLRGTVTHGSVAASTNRVQLVGVTPEFWQFAPQPRLRSLGQSDAAINQTLAARLNLHVGDPLIVRLQKPGILPGSAPVAGADSALQSLRCTVAAVVSDDEFGRFSLESTQVPPPSVFLPIARLQEALERPGQANLVLLEATRSPVDWPAAIRASAQLADYGLTLRWLESAQAFELTSNRIFIDPAIGDAVLRTLAGAQPVLSYLVNEFRVRDRTAPYSIATATTAAAAPFLPADLGSREIVLNRWLADDLQAGVGDEVRLTFFQAAPGGALTESAAAFRVRAVVPLEGLAADRAWMPEFPGMTNVQHQRDWNPGLPLKLDRIRPQDERYWDDYRGTPKAFLAREAGRELWSTRWGSATALRIPSARGREPEVTRLILDALRPEMNQLQLRPLRSVALEGAESPVDFAGLFVGMSFFLIAAALGLVAMLFQLSLLQRNREDALLGAVGISARKLLCWRLGEATVLLLVAGALGLLLATQYTRGILRLLESIWSADAASSTFVFAAQPASIAIGGTVFVVLSLAAIWLAIRRQTRRALSIRLAAQVEEPPIPAERIRRQSFLVAGVATAAAIAAVALARHGLPTQAAFYLAGFALLAAGVAVCRGWLARAGGRAPRANFDAATLGTMNLQRRRTRSLVVVALIATAVFMVLSVAAFRKHVGDDWRERGSGTGGFTFWVETTAPINVARDGRAVAGFDVLDSVARELGAVVPLRTGTGDNINCFNLNSSLQPQLLAVDAAALAARGAFRLKPSAPGWKALTAASGAGTVPAFVDETTLLWALKRKVGDVLDYTDENGRPFRVQIVGALPDSIFQGCVVIDEQAFLQRFPTNAGYSILLVDAADSAPLPELRTRLATALRDVGGKVEFTRDILASFHGIENTYIGIFSVLGSLGVILGSLGLAIVVARNLRERQGEFAVLTAIGLPRGVLARMVVAEFGRLVLWGVAIGVFAAAIAIAPGVTTLPAAPTFALVAALLGGIVAVNLAGGWLIFRWSLRAPNLAQAAL